MYSTCIFWEFNCNSSVFRTLKELVTKKVCDMVPEWDKASKYFRLTMAGFVFFMALCSIVMSFLPSAQAAAAFPEYRHMDHPPV